ncbi:hypothetical protein OHW19_01490 [Acinetobacter baumannii]|nr:hypothetical protein [Acinetobacter baumannii]
MKDKTLEQKVSLALYGAVIFFAFLFTLGLILKADLFGHWPTASEVYEVGRDALTLTAYFLAPAAALVLFSDWRLEHVEKSREAHGKEIYNLVKQIDSQLHDLEMEIQDEEICSKLQSIYMENIYKELLSNMTKLSGLLNEFEFDDDKAKEFKELVNQIKDIQRETFVYLERMYSAIIKANDIPRYKIDYPNDTDEKFLEEQQRTYDDAKRYVQENFHKKFPLLEKLKPLKEAIKVKVESPN